MDQPTLQPTSKVAAAGIAGALTIILVYALGQFSIDVPAGVASAITTIIAFAAGYIKQEPV